MAPLGRFSAAGLLGMCDWPSTDCWPLMYCCVSTSIVTCIEVGTNRFDIERVAFIKLHVKKLAFYDLSSFYWLWIGHGGARQLGFGQGQWPY